MRPPADVTADTYISHECGRYGIIYPQTTGPTPGERVHSQPCENFNAVLPEKETRPNTPPPPYPPTFLEKLATLPFTEKQLRTELFSCRSN